MKHKIDIRTKYAAVAILSGMVGGAILTGPLGAMGPAHSSRSALGAGAKTLGHVPACGQGASPIAMAVKLVDARSASALQAAGFRVGASRAVAPDTSTTALGTPMVALIGLRKADGTPVDPATVNAVPGVQGASAVFPQSSDPTLRSCDYKIQDRPQGQALVSTVETALAAAGVASRQQMDGPGAMYLVSDNPLDPAQVIVTIDVPSDTGTALPNGQGTAFDEVSHEAFVDRGTGHVTQIVEGLPS